MSGYKTDQEFVVYRSRRFHFVSYEGQPADLARHRDEQPATWFLMEANKRWPALPQIADQDRGELVRGLTEWLERSVFAGVEPAPATPIVEPPVTSRRGGHRSRR